MKGREYEHFAFEKFRSIFPTGRVAKNDRIRGHLSGLSREIDVSIRFLVDGVDLLYIAQCKDWKAPADVNVIGEFSSVIQDVQASKGFLLCTSGFAASNRTYARTLGIELITFEDITSDRWKADVEIPVIYIRKIYLYSFNLSITGNEALQELARDEDLVVTINTESKLSFEPPAHPQSIGNIIGADIDARGMPPAMDIERDLLKPNLHIQIEHIWVPCNKFSYTVRHPIRKLYLKYVEPDEYFQLKDHVRGLTIPLHIALKEFSTKLDESFVEIQGDAIPVFSGFNIELEEWADTATR